MSHLSKTTTSILCGAGVGAVLMYLFDPDKGEHRRDYLTNKAAGAASMATEAVGSSLHTLAHQAHDLGQAVADHARHLASHTRSAAGDAASSAADRAQDLASHLSDGGARGFQAMRGYAGKAAHAAQRQARSLLGVEKESGFGAIGVTVTAATALALGAGLMFLLDPMRGGQRRSTIRRTATRAANRAAAATRDVLGRAGNYVSSLRDDHSASATDTPHEQPGGSFKSRPQPSEGQWQQQ